MQKPPHTASGGPRHYSKPYLGAQDERQGCREEGWGSLRVGVGRPGPWVYWVGGDFREQVQHPLPTYFLAVQTEAQGRQKQKTEPTFAGAPHVQVECQALLYFSESLL